MSIFKDNHIADGGQNVAVPAHLNFGKFMFENIRLLGDEVALRNISTGQKYTYKELTQLAVDMAVGFFKLGFRNGDVVVLCNESMEFVPMALAVIFTGATLVPYSTAHVCPKDILKTVSPTYMINCSEQFWNKHSDTLEDIKFKSIVTTCDVPRSAIPLQDVIEKKSDVDKFTPADVLGQTDTALIYFSSGTSGFPKAVELTHLNCILHCLSDDYSKFSKGFKCRPWTINYYGFKTFMFLVSGKEMVHCDTISINTLLGAIEKYKIDVAFLNPQLIYQLANLNGLGSYDLSSLRVIFSRSAPLQKEIIEKVKYKVEMRLEIWDIWEENATGRIMKFPANVEIVQAYGMTECGELASGTRVLYGAIGVKHGSVGIPSRGIILKVVNPESGEKLPPNTNGEICVKGAALMKGYVGVDPSSYLDKEGFFKTGDLGYYDDDGYFYVIDRIKDIMIVNSCNLSPIFLETTLQLHPGVQEAGVVGIQVLPIGDAPIAFVVKQSGSDVTEQELKNHVKTELGHDFLYGVRFISELPRNERGKILRRQLKELLNKETIEMCAAK